MYTYRHTYRPSDALAYWSFWVLYVCVYIQTYIQTDRPTYAFAYRSFWVLYVCEYRH